MAYRLVPPVGSEVTVESATRRDTLLSRGWRLVEEPTESAPTDKRPAAKRTASK